MSALRLRCAETKPLIHLCSDILKSWENYSDSSADILAFSNAKDSITIPHNAITPIARKTVEGLFEIDLVFRNNRISDKHPQGIFHPHEELHHVKKENIGLIEVMGLFILPGRLQVELNSIKDILSGKIPYETIFEVPIEHPLNKHNSWIKHLVSIYGCNLDIDIVDNIIREEVGSICLEVLHHASVFKDTSKGQDALLRFLQSINIMPQ